MEPSHDKNYFRVHKLAVIVVVLVVVAGLAGWLIGRNRNTANDQTTITTPAASVDDASTESIKALVTYTLPDNWKEASCPGVKAVLVVPAGATSNCEATPVAPIKLSVDAGNTTDCNQLQNNSGVKKHTCISLFINGHKTIKSSTEYPPTVNAYYFDSGNGIVKADYTFTGEGAYQAGFDQLANSLQAK